VEAPGEIAGAVALADATGAPVQCEVRLHAQGEGGAQETVAGVIRHCAGGVEMSSVKVWLELAISAESQCAMLKVHLDERAPAHRETSEALAAAATLVHWIVLALARRWGRAWLLHLALGSGQSDRVVSRVLDELVLAAELAADAMEGWACCLLAGEDAR
jgi:hypothetical protein